MKRIFSSFLIIAAAFLWGCIGLFYKQLTTVGFTSTQIVFLRMATAGILMIPIILFRDIQLFRIRLRDCWMFVGTGVLSLAFFNFCYFRAIDELSPSVAAVLLYTAPAFVMLISVFLFGETVTFRKITALGMTVVGCLFVTEIFLNTESTFVGVLFGIGSGVGYALYTIFGTYAVKRYRTETITFYTFVFAALSMLPFCGISELCEISCVYPMQTLNGSLMIGCLAALLPYLCYTAGLKGVTPSNAAMMATLEPVVAAVVGILFLNDTMTTSKGVGIVLILMAVIYINWKPNNKKDRHT